MTLRLVAVGRSSRSDPLLLAGTSGWSRKVNRCERSLPSLSSRSAVMVGGRQRHDGVKRTLEAAAILAPRCSGPGCGSAARAHGAQQ